MAWTSPKTWTSEPLTSIDLNTYVRDNQNHIKDRIDSGASHVVAGARNYSTTATNWVDVDPKELALTLQVNGGAVLIGFTGAIRHHANGKTTYFNIAVDDNNFFSGDGFTQLVNASRDDIVRFKPICFVVMIPALALGSHVFKLRWKTVSGNTTAMDVEKTRPQFWAKEI